MRSLALLLTLLVCPTVLGQTPSVSPFVAGMSALEGEDLEEAARQLEAEVDQNPQNAEAHYALAQVHAAPSPLQDERAVLRHLDRALRLDPRNARYLEARLEALRRTFSEEKAFSMTDTRRPALARRILDLDSTSALAHEELALSAFLEFDWRRGLAGRTGGWSPEEDGGRSGAANRAHARTLEHLDAALASDPGRVSAHRLRLRFYADTRDRDGLREAAQDFAAALPGNAASTLYLALSRYQDGDIREAQRLFDAALASMPSEERAPFQSITFMLTEEEAAAYAADSSGFVERFWAARDPRLLSNENERHLDHYARLALADLLFADVRSGKRGWETPRGEVVVRYGMPDAEGRQLASNVIARDFGAYEGWVYGGEDGFTLRFVDPFRSGDYDFPSSAAGEDDATRARSLFHRQPERFRYTPPRGLTPFPHTVAAFRGPKGRTDVVVPFGIPLAQSVDPSDAGLILGIDSGVFLLDPDGLPVADARQQTARLTHGAAALKDAQPHLLNALTVTAKPGAYTLAVEFEQKRTEAIGMTREALTVRDLSGSGLQLSDVLPSLLVEETEGEVGAGWLRRGAFAIQPAPWSTFATDEQFYLYFELYGLAQDGGRTDYEVEAILKPQDDAGVLARAARRLFGRQPPSGVSSSFSASSTTSSEGQYVVLDIANQAPGTYTLTLVVEDRVSGTRVTSTRTVTLQAPEPSAPPRR